MSSKQNRIQEYDKKYWDYYGRSDIDNIHHIVGHLNKLLGKIGEYTDVVDHDANPSNSKIVNEVIPDLLAHGYRLAYLLNVDADDLFDKRLTELKKHFDKLKYNNE